MSPSTGDGAPPGEMPPGAPPPVASGSDMSYIPTADLLISKISLASSGIGGLFGMTQLSGNFQVTIKNNGPDSVSNLKVNVWCGAESIDRNTNSAGPSAQNTVTVMLDLASGKSTTVDSGVPYDMTKYTYAVQCKVITDPGDVIDDHTLNGSAVQDFK